MKKLYVFLFVEDFMLSEIRIEPSQLMSGFCMGWEHLGSVGEIHMKQFPVIILKLL